MCRAETATAHTTPSMASIASSSPSISVFEEAATLNNEGIIALCQHDEDRAIAALTNSIRLMKRELSKPNVDLSSFRSKDGSSSNMELPAQMIQLPLPLQEQKQCLFCEDEDEEALFSNAVSIPISAFSESQQPSDLDIHIYSAAVVFNLALAHQQLALKHKQERRRNTPEEGSPCLYTANCNKAEKLYSVILKLLQDAACSQVRTGVMVKLAAIHNLHWLQYSKREHNDGAAGCSSDAPSLQQTLSRFVHGIRQHDPQLARTFLEEDAQIQGLLMNVLWLKDQQAPPKVAPAA